MKPFALLLCVWLTLAGCPAWADGELVNGPDRRHEIDLRIEALDAERAGISTEGPKIATVLGLGMLVGGGIAMGVGLGRCCSNDEPDPIAAVGTGVALLGAGGLTTLIGGIIWSRRANQLDAIDAERNSLIDERERLPDALSRLEVGGEYRNGTRFVTVGVRF